MIESFGKTRDGGDVHRITLQSDALKVSLLTLGAILQDVRFSGGGPLTLGSPDLSAYDGGPLEFFGPIVGPVAGRIAHARGRIGEQDIEMEPGPHGHALHTGAAGLHRKVWEIEDRSGTSVLLSCESPDGEGGLPGNRRFTAGFSLTGNALEMRLAATTDAATWVVLANHSYWRFGPELDGHRLKIAADHYLVGDETILPTGEIAPVDGTRYDFRDGRALVPSDIIDNTFALSSARRALAPVLTLEGPEARLELETTEPGLVIYTLDPFKGKVTGHDGETYGPRSGIAIEPQFFPDAPSQPHFPSVLLEPGQQWEQTTLWRFSRPD